MNSQLIREAITVIKELQDHTDQTPEDALLIGLRQMSQDMEEEERADKEMLDWLRTLVGYVESRVDDLARPHATAAAARARLGNMFDV